MLKRKIEKRLLDWKNEPDHNPLVVKGCRQCGKTYAVTHFAKEHYSHVVNINFLEDASLCEAFDRSLNIDDIVMSLSAIMGKKADFVEGETCVILDEIQQCPNARTALKFFKLDGRYDVIATGSLLGVSGYNERVSSIPVGYETIIDMYPLDFEEFLWANEVTTDIIDYIRNHLTRIEPVPEAIHNRMRNLLLQYVAVGGMPAVVAEYVNTRRMDRVLAMQRGIVNDYRDDMVKYAPASDKSRIRECFNSIPRQLSKKYKKFQYSVVKKGAGARDFEGCLQWIEDAGIINRCRNLSIPELPLDGNAVNSEFKIYMADIGLLTSMLEDGTQADVISGNLLGYKGAIYENLFSDFLGKAGRKQYYYRKDSGLEIDFVTSLSGKAIPIECKATSGNAKSLRTILCHPEKYHITEGIKLGDYNIGQANGIITLPFYMGALVAQGEY